MVSPSGPVTANVDQALYWGSAPGRKWIDYQEPLDRAMLPVGRLLLQRAAPAAGERVLDIGCGAGATTLALAASVGAEGSVVALDISPPLLARAAERLPADLSPRVAFIEGDAQTYGFPAGRFDLLVSRFGIMFFEDPLAAFRNLRSALRPGGRMEVAAWAPIEANPWFVIARDAAIARLGRPEPSPPEAPGPFAFCDRERVLGILRAAGFANPAAEAVALHFEPPGSLEEVARLACNIGPAARIMAALGGGPDDAAAIYEAVRSALAAYREGEGIRVPALVNFFSAGAT